MRVDDADRYGRGGLLPMAVFLTQNSPGLRTSPVKRGNWVVQRVLGMRFRRRRRSSRNCRATKRSRICPCATCWPSTAQNPVCAACHARFDSFGLAFEGTDRSASARTKDLAGRPVDTAVPIPGGVQGTGLEGLQAFIREHRQNEFVNNLSRKLLSLCAEPVAAALRRIPDRTHGDSARGATGIASIRWWKPSSPARSF